ncbi:MAG: hypothetical protein HQL06_01880 [Nitrospirae bacterium]|nr:hypothetical protein [Nitrospirota bacterium]
MPFDSVRIGNIANITSEPKLQDKLYEALAVQFMKRGVRVSDSSDNVFEGRINFFSVFTLTEKKGYASDYEVVAKGDFTLRRADGTVRNLKGMTSVFSETFESADRLNELVAHQESADDRAIEGLALRIISELLY